MANHPHSANIPGRALPGIGGVESIGLVCCAVGIIIILPDPPPCPVLGTAAD